MKQPLIFQAEGSFNVNTVMADIVVLTVFALALDSLTRRIETRLMKWQPKTSETEKLSGWWLLAFGSRIEGGSPPCVTKPKAV